APPPAPACGTTTAAIDSPVDGGCVFTTTKDVPVTATATFSSNVHFAADRVDCSTFAILTPNAAAAGVASSGGHVFSATLKVPSSDNCYTIHAAATNACGGGKVDAKPVTVWVTDGGCSSSLSFSHPEDVRRNAAWSSDLMVEQGRLQLIVNGSSASFPGH